MTNIKAPWTTHTGQEIFEHDTLINIIGDTGEVIKIGEDWAIKRADGMLVSLPYEIFTNEAVVMRD